MVAVKVHKNTCLPAAKHKLYIGYILLNKQISFHIPWDKAEVSADSNCYRSYGVLVLYLSFGYTSSLWDSD